MHSYFEDFPLLPFNIYKKNKKKNGKDTKQFSLDWALKNGDPLQGTELNSTENMDQSLLAQFSPHSPGVTFSITKGRPVNSQVKNLNWTPVWTTHILWLSIQVS